MLPKRRPADTRLRHHATGRRSSISITATQGCQGQRAEDRRMQKIWLMSLAAIGAFTLASTGAQAQDKPVRWKVASIVPSNLVLIGTGGKRFEKIIDQISNGNIRMQLFEPGALVPPF